MTTASVEKRLLTLEKRFETVERMIEERLPAPPIDSKEKRGWQAIVGTFADDPLYDEAMRMGREWREAQVEESASE